MRRQLIALSRQPMIAWILVVILVIIVYWQAAELTRAKRQPLIYPSDDVYVRKAEALWSTKNRGSTVDLMKNRYPIAVHLKNLVCIQLSLEAGSVGGNPVYCFSRSSEALRLRYDDVE